MRQRIAMQVLFVLLALGAFAPSANAAFDIQSFAADVFTDAGHGTVQTQAGSTPYDGVTEFTLNNTAGVTDEQAKKIRVDLPPGLISNPQATPLCSQSDFGNGACDDKSWIGNVDLTISGLPYSTKVYNLEPGPGQVSDFGFSAVGPLAATHIIGGVRDTSDYGLFFTIDVSPQGINLSYSKLTFFGNPAARNGGGGTAAPFIRLPTACAGVQTTKLTIDTYEGHTFTRNDVTDTGATGCNQVPFTPTLAVTPSTTQRDTPTGVKVNVGVPWQTDPTKLAQAHVKNTAVLLPPGMTINPAAATGLEACTDVQFGQGTHIAIACPAASKVGTAKIVSPNLPTPLTGSVYLGQPLADNPYRLFVVVDGFGLSIRLKGTVTPDPNTGQLTTTFANTPQVPFTDFELNLNAGPNATIATPLACGDAPTTSAITPYSGNADATPGSTFTVDLDGAGAACPPTPFALGFTAGTANPLAGAFSPFSLTISRDDGNQFLSGLTVVQPPGLLGLIKSVTPCDEANAAAGTCPESSRVGTSTVASGAGSAPFTLSGPVYLSGPYGGGPFGLVIVIRAVAGPFDLGTVVVRAAIKVDQTDSHLTIETPQLPTILQGIPLRLRTVKVDIDRNGFIFNPTNCDQMAVKATLKSSEGTTQDVSSPFQATGCDALPYAPKMTLTTRATAKGAPAPLVVSLSQTAGEANTKRVAVQLPIQLSANFATLSKACPEATFEADPKTCAAGSRVGTVSAVTPVLSEPLGGIVYLEGHTGTLPTLEAVLEGSGLTVNLSGTIKTGNGIQSTFETVPDVPITAFTLALPVGPNPALAASSDLCAAPLQFSAAILGQNGKQVDVKSPVGVAGCGVQITKAKVKGRKARITMRVPSKGVVTLRGKGIKKAKKSSKAAGTMTAVVKLNKAGIKALKKARKNKAKRKRKLVIKLGAGFAPARGATAAGEAVKRSRASRKLTFK